MHVLPPALIGSLQGINGFDKEAFEKVHESGERVTSIRINPSKPIAIENRGFQIESSVPWTSSGYYLKERPSFTFDPLFHAGCYYVQEASGMFLEEVLKQTVDLTQPLKVLDLCAAPGGKSTHIQSLISTDSLLVSNEVIRGRNNILADNIIKWGCNNVIVTQNDPRDFGGVANYFDVIVVDAPCSGSGLFRRDPDAIMEWSENNVQLCCQRQQRILADILPALKSNGVLIYSTCSYSKEEDEDIMEWIIEKWEMENIKLEIEDNWGIVETSSTTTGPAMDPGSSFEKDNLQAGGYGYRFFPDKIKGEGFFITCFRKKDGEEKFYFKTSPRTVALSAKETTPLKPWIKEGNNFLIKHDDKIFAIPGELATDMSFFISRFRVTYFGTLIGELIRDKLVPAHALAMSDLISDDIHGVELGYEEAIKYLKKQDPGAVTEKKGWQLVTFKNHPLGWINVLANRVNNYYPKELRIFKD